MLNDSRDVAGLGSRFASLRRIREEFRQSLCELVLDQEADTCERVEAAIELAVRPRPEAIPWILRSLHDLGPATLSAVLHRFEPAIGDTALAWLTDDDHSRRAAGSLAFIQLQNAWSIEPLLRLAHEYDAEIRGIKCFALAHQAPAEADAVLEKVSRIDPSSKVRNCARQAFQILQQECAEEENSTQGPPWDH